VARQGLRLPWVTGEGFGRGTARRTTGQGRRPGWAARAGRAVRPGAVAP